MRMQAALKSMRDPTKGGLKKMTQPTLSHSVRFLLILAVLVVPITDVHSEELVAKPLAWNVFLGPWQIIGPFPKADDGEHGLGADYLGGETVARPPGEVSYQGETYRWQGYERQVLDFDTAFDPDTDNDNVVAYAWTRFTSCLLYTSPSPRDRTRSRMPSSA